MFIAFEGPDNVGKSTSAASLDYLGEPTYNATKRVHEGWQNQELDTESLVHTYDRIDWFSHMVYRLALPEHNWNDDRNRTVFAMPDTHLVVKLHRPDLAQHISDELYETGTLARVNPMYWYFTDYFARLNEVQEYALFKTVSVIEVVNDPRNPGTFSQELKLFYSPATTAAGRLITTDEELLALLREDDHQRL